MRQYLQEVDLVIAEVHKVGSQASSGGADGPLRLHMRSNEYIEMENGYLSRSTDVDSKTQNSLHRYFKWTVSSIVGL
jgi:exosome complex RNA-binding protein Rrp4